MDIKAKLAQGSRSNFGTRERDATKSRRFDELFDQKWEVLVIKKHRETGKFIWKTACCALTPV